MGASADGKTDLAAAIPHLDPDMCKLLGHPLRHEILVRLRDGPASAGTLAREMDESTENISAQIKVLRKAGAVELVQRRPGAKGGNRYIYRAVERSVINAEEWEALPPIAQANIEITNSQMLQREIVHSVEEGCFYEDPGHVLIRDPMWLDEEGKRQIDEIMVRAHQKATEVHRESTERRARSEERPTRMILAFLSFPAARKDIRSEPEY